MIPRLIRVSLVAVLSSTLLFIASAAGQVVAGGVGIGTTAPEAPLHVDQFTSGVAKGVGNSILKLDADGAMGFQMQDKSDALGRFWQFSNVSLNTIFRISRSGTGGTEFSLTDAGNLTIRGTLTQASDARFKTQIEPLGDVLSKLGRIRGVAYRSKTEQADEQSRRIGLLAQEVQAAFPELVLEDDEGILSVAYGNFTAVLLEAVKEQQRQNEQLAARLSAIEQQNQELRSKIATLDAALDRLESAVTATHR